MGAGESNLSGDPRESGELREQRESEEFAGRSFLVTEA